MDFGEFPTTPPPIPTPLPFLAQTYPCCVEYSFPLYAIGLVYGIPS